MVVAGTADSVTGGLRSVPASRVISGERLPDLPALLFIEVWAFTSHAKLSSEPDRWAVGPSSGMQPASVKSGENPY
jgi:hypothetical protein